MTKTTHAGFRTFPLGLHWPTADPFLFCAHHDDDYPPANEALGPAASLDGRDLGMDFTLRDGFRMYHGTVVPGFPQHPHRGFETVTLARHGYIDHSDSLGAKARFGRGDVQWMTAGRGVVHSEMFPLLERERRNRVELFQVWLNLPAADKLVEPHFAVLWGETIPHLSLADGAVDVALVAGRWGETAAPAPPPRSWAARADSAVRIATLSFSASAEVELPATPEGVGRVLYLYEGAGATVGDQVVPAGHGVLLSTPDALRVVTSGAAEALLLEGRPIAEPVAQHGPFVMNTNAELQRAFLDYQRTRFGGWPWDRDDPVHGAAVRRFAVHVDGREELPPGA